MRLKRTMAAILALVAVFTGACAREADRVVEIAMTDNAFSPNTLTVATGETVLFKFSNNGAVAHDAFIGDAAAQDDHGESMSSGENADGHHMEGSDALHLEPGKSGDLIYTFDEAGEILIGCHQPGHYEAVMQSTLTVSPLEQSAQREMRDSEPAD